ncbi:coadhesin-like isoform X2 [Ruditapes philippinarum]|uniref:coadhesin-like isoform X2 n=1 Tax=Ruditapes philippinarum TaxID=129788 RepID=UPI00295AFAD7|nr:coadhesin-like isoform X2 [Ruditapes philippinarum]
METKKLNEQVMMKRVHDHEVSNEYSNLTITSNVTGDIHKDNELDESGLQTYANLEEKRNTTQYSKLSSNSKRDTKVHEHYEEIEIPTAGTPKLNCDIKESKEVIKEEKVAEPTQIQNALLNINFVKICVLVQVALTLCCCGIGVYVLTVINKDENDALQGNGVWDVWGQWESCSVTCNVGLEIRHRQCSNKEENSYYCSGSTTEYRLCLLQPCSIRAWLDWGPWSGCSASCDGGLRSRSRDFDWNGTSSVGQYWQGGEFTQVQICGRSACSDGGWAVWTSWGNCNVTCGRGVQTRTRTCSNPSPSSLGQYCKGDSLQVKTCETRSCTGFNVNLATVQASSNLTTMIFTDVLFNIGSAYNTSTGIFTAPMAGLYQFNVHICTQNSGNDIKYAFIVEGKQIYHGELKIVSNGTECMPFSTVVNVQQNGTALIQAAYSNKVSGIINMFSGYLIYQT